MKKSLTLVALAFAVAILGAVSVPTVAQFSPAIQYPITATKGGTGIVTYTKGDTIYASAANTLSKLAVGTDGDVLTLASGVPSWAPGASGLVPTATGRIPYASGTSSYTNAASLTYNNALNVTTNGVTGGLIFGAANGNGPAQLWMAPIGPALRAGNDSASGASIGLSLVPNGYFRVVYSSTNIDPFDATLNNAQMMQLTPNMALQIYGSRGTNGLYFGESGAGFTCMRTNSAGNDNLTFCDGIEITTSTHTPGLVAGFVNTSTNNYAPGQADHTIAMDTSAGNRTTILPASASAGRNNGRIYVFKKISTDANTFTIDRNGALINGAAANITTVLTTLPTFILQWDETAGSWWQLN